MESRTAQDTPPRDLRPIDFNALTWCADDIARSLENVANAVTAEAVNAINWYLEKKRSQKRGARRLRVIAIVLSTAAALLAIVIEIFEPEIVRDGRRLWGASPTWSSVLLIVAFGLVLLGRFYGFSLAWMRFLSAEFQIRETLHAFRMDWQIGRAGWKDGMPTEQQI